MFSNCTFVQDEELPDGIESKTMFTMNDVDGVRVLGCTFRDDIHTDQPSVMGIYTIDAGFTVNRACDIVQILPCLSYQPSRFINLLVGVTAKNTRPLSDYVNVEYSTFKGCRHGVSIDGNNHSIVVNNTFESGLNWPSLSGVITNAATNYQIAENTILGQTTGNQGFIAGIYIRDS